VEGFGDGCQSANGEINDLARNTAMYFIIDSAIACFGGCGESKRD